jgi:hypothetical protein
LAAKDAAAKAVNSGELIGFGRLDGYVWGAEADEFPDWCWYGVWVRRQNGAAECLRFVGCLLAQGGCLIELVGDLLDLRDEATLLGKWRQWDYALE